MIRINLLAPERRPAAPTRTPVGHRAGLAGCAVVLAAALGLMLRAGLAMGDEADRLDERMRVLDGQLAVLDGVTERRGQVEGQADDLARRVARVEALRAAQGAPARMLDAVSRVLPADVWLTELRQQGDDVSLAGRAAGMTGVAELVDGLESSGYFPPPIEIVDSRLEGQAAIGAVHFEIRARFLLPPS